MPPSRKRAPPYTIDLTQSGSDDALVPADTSRTRKQQRASNGSAHIAPSQSFHDDELEAEGDENVVGSQDYNEGAWQRLLFYGHQDTKIVGVRFYRGEATPGEMTRLRREPQNIYDRNAIQVLNVRGEQVGHIPRKVAEKLAKYMDNGSLRLEGTINGYMGDFDCPIKLKYYGPSETVEKANLMRQMQNDKLPLNGIKQAEKEQKEKAKLQLARQKELQRMQKQARKNGAEYVGGRSVGLEPTVDIESIIGASERFDPRNVGQTSQDFGKKEKDLEAMPMASQPESLSAELLPFQRQGLQWLLTKESPQLPSQGSKDICQMWQRSQRDQNMFTNIATNFSIKGAPPPLASGGILADDMGLGKTVQIIALIAADKALREQRKESCGATLIIAPLGVMSNWSSQIQRHVKSQHELRVLTYHGSKKRKLDGEEIKKYDVVITTYGAIASEAYQTSKTLVKVPTKQGLFSFEWRRIVVDEGHNLRNPTAKKTVAAMNLMAHSRWILTGTPIVNSLRDLYSLTKFIRLSGGLEHFELFQSAIIRPVNQGDAQGSRLLQLLMSDLTLRRRKDMSFIDLKLPALTEYVHRVSFLDHEKEKYEALEAEAKGTLDKYRENLASRGQNSGKAYRHLLEILVRMRQLCNHWKMCGEGRFKDIMDILEKEKVLDLTPENREALQGMLQLNIDAQDDCPICLDSLKEPVITCCAHVFCFPCAEKVIETQGKCPMCRAELPSVQSLVHPKKEVSAKVEIDVETSSSKVEALLSILQASQKKGGKKTVVFSQWTTFLDIIQARLDQDGYKYTRIDGMMNAGQRDAAMDALEQDPDCTIMLASLGVCSVGLNLVAANQVVLADTWWAPTIEDQAIDRVHRLGQKKPTTVFRLVVEGSIEERVLEIQTDKRKLMNLAFSEAAGKRDAGGKSARLADIEKLLG